VSSLPPVIGHEAERTALGRAVLGGELPGSLLFHGPPGIGKQRLALWLAQRLVCTGSQQPEPCGTCKSCRLTLRLEHPDVHWFFPIQRPKISGGPDRMADAMEDVRAVELANRREAPYRPTEPGEPLGLYLGQVQTIRRMAVSRPSMGDYRAFIIGDAELLTSQEASQEAANALLKVLEEPPPGTTMVLTTADADALLPTIRSRMLPVRLQPLPEGDVAQFLIRVRAADPRRAELAAKLSQGSIGRALAFLGEDGESSLDEMRLQARALLEAATETSEAARLSYAHALAPAGARGAFGDVLDFLALWLRDLAATATGAEDVVVNIDSRPLLRSLAERLPRAASGVPDAIRAIEEARFLGRNNVNPQLTLAWLLGSIHGSLAP
jgi:DNA polymerase-3 subunit delta'